MFKPYVTLVFLIVSFFSLQAQFERSIFKAGFNAGIPVTEVGDFYNFSVGADVFCHFGLSRELDAGFTTGFVKIFGKTTATNVGGSVVRTDFEDIQYIPAAGSLRFYFTDHVKIGGDFGYVFSFNENLEEGLYYRPSFAFDLNDNTEINFSYVAVNSDTEFAMAVFSILFLF